MAVADEKWLIFLATFNVSHFERLSTGRDRVLEVL
jgi:hypothetical protein